MTHQVHRTIKSPLLGWLLLLPIILAAAEQPTLLNSERIQQRYGSYGIEVLSQNEEYRFSRLYSDSGNASRNHTLAVVHFAPRIDPAYRDIHEQILGGASLGAAFKRQGWSVVKHNQVIDVIPAHQLNPCLQTLLGVNHSQSLALHIYPLDVVKDGQVFNYATLAEIHAPDYLSMADLLNIYAGLGLAPHDTIEVDALYSRLSVCLGHD